MINLPDHARIWIYAAERPLSATEAERVIGHARRFVSDWTAHNHMLEADADLLYDRFLVLAVDESRAGASGCSIDKSVHFVRSLGGEIGTDFFNRMIFSYRDDQGEVKSLAREDFRAAYREGKIDDSSSVFDPLVKTVGELKTQFEKPLAESWHKRMV